MFFSDIKELIWYSIEDLTYFGPIVVANNSMEKTLATTGYLLRNNKEIFNYSYYFIIPLIEINSKPWNHFFSDPIPNDFNKDLILLLHSYDKNETFYDVKSSEYCRNKAYYDGYSFWCEFPTLKE